MADSSTIQISTDVGLSMLGTLLVAVAGATWWFASQLKKITDTQTAMKSDLTSSQAQLKSDLTASQGELKADLTKSINEVNASQEKRDNDLDRSVASVSASLASHSTLIEQKMNTLQLQMQDVSSQIKENRTDTNELRERVVRLETLAEKLGGHS